MKPVATPRAGGLLLDHDRKLFPDSLGTALGDWMADTNSLGFGNALSGVRGRACDPRGGLISSLNASRVLLFWACLHLLTRPLGATLGDLFDKPIAQGGPSPSAATRRPRCSPQRWSPHRYIFRQRPGVHPRSLSEMPAE